MCDLVHPADKFFWYCLVIFLTLNLMVFYGIFAVYITADLVFGSVLSGFFYGFWCGAATAAWRWTYLPSLQDV